MSRLDYLYRSILLTKFFVRGWGKPENLKRIINFRKIMSNRETCQHLVSPDYPIHIDKEVIQKEVRIIDGHFKSPFVDHLPGIMPEEVETAKFQMILPLKWKGKLKPVCLHLAGTGDHYFWRRRSLLARPLLKEAGIASIILENPYYGFRKPKEQRRSSLLNVSDLFVMGGALVLESLALFHWCERNGYGPLGVSGFSMGGFMASLAATNWHKPISLIPCLSWSTASIVFTKGVMSGAIPWQLLQEQYSSNTTYMEDLTKLIVSPEDLKKDNAFQLGQDFARSFPESVDTMQIFQDKFYTGIHDNTVGNDFISEYTIPSNGKDQCSNSSNSSQNNNSQSAAQYHTSSNSNTQTSKTNDNENKKSSNSHRSKYISSPIDNLQDFLYSGKAMSFLHLGKKSKPSRTVQDEALQFMRGIMDECTHLGNFSCPLDPSLIIIVSAKNDAYVPQESVLSLEEIWPGSEVRYVESGHIAAFLFNQKIFRQAITESFERQIAKYYN